MLGTFIYRVFSRELENNIDVNFYLFTGSLRAPHLINARPVKVSADFSATR